jgi:uncharacterized protein (DUF58 family)
MAAAKTMSDSVVKKSFITQQGAIFSAVAVVLLLLGFVRIDGMMAAIGLGMLLLLGTARWMGRANLSDIGAEMQSAQSGYAGNRLLMRFSSAQLSGLPVRFDLRYRLLLTGIQVHEGKIARLNRGEIFAVDGSMELPKRGHNKDLQCHVSSHFPFSLWEHTSVESLACDLTIFPRPMMPRQLAFIGLLRDANPAQGAALGAAAGELRGLRPWRAGDSMKSMHIAASARSFARGASWIVAETDPPGYFPKAITLMFHSYASDRAIIRPELFEKSLSQLCGTLRYLVGRAIPVTLMADFDDWVEHPCLNRAQLHHVLQRLARVTRSQHTERHDFCRAQQQVEADHSLWIFSDMASSGWSMHVAPRQVPALCVSSADEVKRRKPQRSAA